MGGEPVNFPFKSVLIVPAGERATAGALAAAVTGGDPAAEERTYAIPLSPGGASPATDYACCTAVSPEMLTRMQAALAAGMLSGVRYYRWSAGEGGALLATNGVGAALGEPWSYRKSLENAGLIAIGGEGLPHGAG
jgi:hypothetical protein